MKKTIIITVLAVVLAVAGVIGILLYSGTMMFQLPVMVQKNPRITFVLGTAYFKGPGDPTWRLAIVGQELKSGYEVKTEAKSQVDIRFTAETAVKVTEDAVFRIDEITVKKLHLNMQKGSVFGKFEKLFKNYDIQVRTPTTIAGIRGTELCFTVTEELPSVKEAREKKKPGRKAPVRKPALKPGELPEDEKPVPSTTVFSLSGITEIVNPRFTEQVILLAYQNKIDVGLEEPPTGPVGLTPEETAHIRSRLNSIHLEEVLFISDKIGFKVNSADILPESFPELDKVVTILRQKKVRVRIEGHTDSQGDNVFNQGLSVKRAQAIRAYFVGKEIKAEMIETVGYGASKPVADNKNEAGRAQNRRVEFLVIE